jgi:3'(2'), 5'-bisphosphate nucleotidase
VTKLPFGLDINNLIDDLRILSWEAADILIYYSNLIRNPKEKANIIQNKTTEDPVTLADLKVNEIIINGINKNYKNIGWDILSEENVKDEFSNFEAKSDWCWVLDPLDGTKDFIQGTGNYAMHLALNYKQKPLIGVVLIPEKNQLWISNGRKSWCESRDGTYLKTNLLQNKRRIHDMTIVTSKNHRNQTLKKVIEKLNFKDQIVMGSVGCKIASILRGESNIYICLSLPGKSSPKDWDFAAPEAILKTAGGSLTNLNNDELSYGGSNFEQGGIIVATNDKFSHKSICSEIMQVIRKFDLYPFD